MIELRKRGKVFEIYRNGILFCYSDDEEIINEVVENLKFREEVLEKYFIWNNPKLTRKCLSKQG